ncbi:MAG: tetratricopeptide repeat protein, partial [Propionibacteriaceae bacterium]|nr:tetratricopeptide repeat protein [Propionibacteriaceae bacterium]
MDADRAVSVTYRRGDEPRRGSGFRLTGDLVLTVGHCAWPDKQGVAATGHAVEWDGRTVTATLAWVSGDGRVDLALLRAPGLPPAAPAGLALVDRERAELVAAWSECFPGFKEVNEQVVRAHVSGVLSPRDGGRRDPLTFVVDSTRSPLPRAAEGWGGASGGGVVCEGGGLVGVIANAWPDEKETTVHVASFDLLDLLPEAKRSEFWALVGTSKDSLPVVVSGLPRAVSGHLPSLAADFVPREAVARLKDKVAGGGRATLMSVQGFRGVGKTQVAVAFFQDCVRAGWPVCWWVTADSRPAVQEGLNVLGHELGVFRLSEVTAEQGVELLLAHLSGTQEPRRLIVFDNVEAMADLAGCLPTAGAATVVLTTAHQEVARASRGEPIDVGAYTPDQAAGYLDRQTGLADRDGALAVAQELACLPLAITHAAATIAHGQRFQTYSYGAYLADLARLPLVDALPAGRDPVDYPGGTARALAASLESALAVSPDRAAAQALLDALSLLDPDGVRIDRLFALGEARSVNDALAALEDSCVITRSKDGERVILHRLVARLVRELNDRHGRSEQAGKAAVTVLAGIDPMERSGFAAQRAEAAELARHVTSLATLRPSAADDPQAIKAAVNCGFALNELHRPAAAIDLLSKAADRATRVLGPDHPNTLTSRNNLAYAYESAGRLDQAIPLYETTLADRARVLGPDHPHTLTSRNNLAYAYESAGRLDQAIPLYEATLADRARILGPDHPDTLTSRDNLAGAYESAGRLDQAIPLFEASLADSERILGPDHPQTLTSRDNLAGAYESA